MSPPLSIWGDYSLILFLNGRPIKTCNPMNTANSHKVTLVSRNLYPPTFLFIYTPPPSPFVLSLSPAVPPAPSVPDIIPLNSTSLLGSWDPLASGDVPGILVNYTVKYNQLHHGHHPSYEVVPASEYPLL